ncbi:uridine diphosphate-N-acetylglucosamine-binding protein YvcK [Pseudactinotalea suaedae]
MVALGGGHGLSATLQALRHVTTDVTAVVTVADDGGSSGRLRSEMDVLPPGDLRMAISALCESSEWGETWRDILQHRFHTDGDLDGHALGNLLLVATWELLGDTVAGLDLIGRLLGATGRVLPMATTPLAIEADVVQRDRPDAPPMVIRGQSRVAVTSGTVERIRLQPEDAEACPEAVAAIEAADWVILGPGSWFTSVMPHLLLPGIRDALHQTPARVALTLNLAQQPGETAGYSAADHLRSLRHYAPDLGVDVVVADPSAIEDLDDVLECASKLGARVLLRQVGVGDGTPRHDPLRLAAAYRDAFEGILGDVGESTR